MGKIIIDSRESRSGIAQLLRKEGVEVESAELEVGDFLLAEGVGIERKTAIDLIASILDRRIFSQAALMKATFARPYVMVEGDPFTTRSQIEPAALIGALSWLSVIEGIQVISTKNEQHSAQMMATMHRHATDGLGYAIALRGAKPKDRRTQAAYLVEGLPGVGPIAAGKLLAAMGSPGAIFSASESMLREVHGVGGKTAAVIREVLTTDVRA